jgi:hypothetical protein
VVLTLGERGGGGAAQMRATSLSDERVIAFVNRHFVPVSLNVTTQGFPTQDIPALRYAEGVFQTNWRFEFGFANCVAVRMPLARACGARGAMSTSGWGCICAGVIVNLRGGRAVSRPAHEGGAGLRWTIRASSRWGWPQRVATTT